MDNNYQDAVVTSNNNNNKPTKTSNHIARLKRVVKSLQASQGLNQKTSLSKDQNHLVFTKSLVTHGSKYFSREVVEFGENSKVLLLPFICDAMKVAHMFAKGGNITNHQVSRLENGDPLLDAEGRPIEGPSRVDRLQQIVTLFDNNQAITSLLQSDEGKQLVSDILDILQK